MMIIIIVMTMMMMMMMMTDEAGIFPENFIFDNRHFSTIDY